MILHKRKGMALITVVLIAALFLISIVGISAKVITEKKVSNARSSSERALVAAETGLSQVLFDLRNTYFYTPDYPNGVILPEGSYPGHYLSLQDAKNIVSNDIGTPLPLSKGEYRYSESDSDVPYITYEMKIKKIGGDTWDPDTPPEEHTALLEIYSLGTVYSSKDGEVLARRVISTECDITFNSSSDTTINYGLLAGGDIEFRGHSQEKGGDIFANGKIISKGQGPDGLRVDEGTAYAVGQIPDGIASGGEVTGMDGVIIPTFGEYNDDVAYAFKTGTEPYDGNTEGYPDTSAGGGLVAAVVQSCLGSDDTGNTLDEIQKFYSDLMGCTVDVDGNVFPPEESCADFNILNVEQLSDLRDNANNIVYYINDDVTIGAADLFNLKGIVVVDGNLTIKGGAIIGDYILDEYGDPISPEEPQFALIVRGTAKKQAGNAEFYGVLYADGGIEMGTGTFDCYGAMITPGNIKLFGDVTVEYKDTGFNETSVSGPVSSGVSEAELGPSSWKEISYEEFSSP